MRDVEILLSAGHSHVTKPALFFHLCRVLERSDMRKEPLLHSREKDDRELETFRIMDRQQRNLRLVVYLIGIAYECGMIQKIGQCLSALSCVSRRIEEFLQVADA